MRKTKTRGEEKKDRKIEKIWIVMTLERVPEICRICAEGWEEETEEIELWLDCSLCGGWFHSKYVGFENLNQEEITDLNYVCNSCNQCPILLPNTCTYIP